MKKNNLLKVLGVCFLFVVFLTWIIPASSYVSGTYTKGSTSPVGLLDLVRIPISVITSYIGYAVLILAIGGLYGVMNRTGVYGKLVDSIKEKFTKKEKVAAIISILFFAILASLTGLNYVLIVFVPFFLAVLLKLGFTKLSALMSTVGAILVGNAASTYGFDVCGYLNYYLGLDVNNNILTKVIFLAILLFLLIMFVLKHGMLDKGAKKSEEPVMNIPLLDDDTYEKKSKKSYIPMFVVFILTFVFLLVACYNWRYAVNYGGFEELYEKVMAVKINGYPILANIIGNTSPLGYWGISEITMTLVLASLLIKWLYSIKFSDYISAFKKGVKDVLPVAFYAVMASVIAVLVLGSSNGNSIYYTFAHKILSYQGKVFNAIVIGGLSTLSGLFMNEFPYYVNYMIGNITAVFTATEIYPLIAFVMQSTFGIMMFVMPTSAILLIGLSYLKVSIQDWWKYVWKYVLEATAVALVIFAVLSYFL